MTGFYFKWTIGDPVIPEGPRLLALTVRLVSSRQGTANYYNMDAGKSCGLANQIDMSIHGFFYQLSHWPWKPGYNLDLFTIWTCL